MRNLKVVLSLLLLTGCAGTTRSCSNFSAENFGADWIVVQNNYLGQPYLCWKLKDTSITNESQSDGIYWASEFGHNVHISGLYDRVQVANGDFDSAAKQLGVDADKCTSGRYPTP